MSIYYSSSILGEGGLTLSLFNGQGYQYSPPDVRWSVTDFLGNYYSGQNLLATTMPDGSFYAPFVTPDKNGSYKINWYSCGQLVKTQEFFNLNPYSYKCAAQGSFITAYGTCSCCNFRICSCNPLPLCNCQTCSTCSQFFSHKTCNLAFGLCNDARPFPGSNTFLAGQSLGPNDLKIKFRDCVGLPKTPYSVSWRIVNKCGFIIWPETPAQQNSPGWFYANWVTSASHTSSYFIEWSYVENSGDPISVLTQEFNAIIPANTRII